MIINNTTNLDLMIEPAKTSDASQGITTNIQGYPDFDRKYLITDTIGLTDNRFDPEEIMIKMKNFIRNTINGLNVIIYCLNYGRIDINDRNTIKFMGCLFGLNWHKSSTIVILNTPPNKQKNDWIMTLDKDLLFLSESKKYYIIIQYVRYK